MHEMPSKVAATCFQGLEKVIGFLATFLYHELLKRNTIRPIQSIIQEPNPEVQRKLLRKWAQTKANESSYIQLAGGFLFTTVASCLQWPGTQNGHWCAPALFYASLLFALVAIVTGSQQLLVVPNERSADADTFAGASLAMKLEDGQESEMAASEREHLQAIVDRLCQTHRTNQSNSLHIFALQAPMMLLSLSVVAFLGGLCSVIIAPLVQLPLWNDHAKIVVVFGAVAIYSLVIFASSSVLTHRLFS